MFQSNVSHGIGRIEVGSCHARCSTSWVATIFFSKGCCIRGVFHACKGWLAAGYFRVPRFLLLCSFCYVCACMTFITCMIMHCVFLLALTSQNLFASHSWNMHACMHASSTSCMWLGDIWLRLVLWDGSFWAGITFGYRMGQHGWGQGKSPAAFHRPGFQEQQDQTESDTQWLSSCWADYFCLKRILALFFCICCSSRWLEAECGCDRAGDQTLRAQTIACYVWTGSAPIFLFSPSKRPRFLQHLWPC